MIGASASSHRTESLRASRAVSRSIRTSPTWMLPFTLRVMMRPLSRPSRTRTLTWTASPVIPVRPTTSPPSAGILSSPAIVSPRSAEASRLLHRSELAGQIVEHGLRLARVEDRDRGRRLAEAHRHAQLLLARDVGVRHALLFAEEGHVGQDLLRLHVLGHHDELGLAALDQCRPFVR